MTTSHLPTEDNLPLQGTTACGARVMITPDTPHIRYHDEVVYFCGEDCKQLYDEDPLNSCLSDRLLSGK